jgi:hypothetical protein
LLVSLPVFELADRHPQETEAKRGRMLQWLLLLIMFAGVQQ